MEECDLMRVLTPWCCICRLRSTCAVLKLQLTESLPEHCCQTVSYLQPVPCMVALGPFEKSSLSFVNSKLVLQQLTGGLPARTVYQRQPRTKTEIVEVPSI